MDVSVGYQLTFKQKLWLALSIFVIYWPLRLYINIEHWEWRLAREIWIIWIVEILLTVSFFIFWLMITEWLEQLLAHILRNSSRFRFTFSGQVLTLVVAAALAVLFNTGFHMLWHLENHLDNKWITNIFHLPRKQPPPNLTPDETFKFEREHKREREQRQKANNGLMMIAMLSAFYLAANRRSDRQLEELRVKAEQLRREATQAQFAALKNQVNPHFLFNSLSILTSLVEIDTRLSVQFINRLSKAYRYILEQRDSEQVSLKTELDFLDSYAFLLNIRFDDKLQVLPQVTSEEAIRYGIAPLTLQLLVENAVKHNQMSAEKPLVVSIYLEKDNLVIANPIQLRPQQEASTGLGLENIVNRYKLLTDRPVWTGEVDGNFVVKIPLLF